MSDPMKKIKSFLTLSSAVCIFILMTLTANATTYTPAFTTTHDGHEYQGYLVQLSWTEAQAYCESLGGHLATFENESERKVLEPLIKDYNMLWVGALSTGNSDTPEDSHTCKWITTGEKVDASDYSITLSDGAYLARFFSAGYSAESDKWYITNGFNHVVTLQDGFICEIEPTKYEIPEELRPVPYEEENNSTDSSNFDNNSSEDTVATDNEGITKTPNPSKTILSIILTIISTAIIMFH